MIDFTKPVQTRDGRPVEIVMTNLRGLFAVAGYIGTNIDLSRWTCDGKYYLEQGESSLDLINVPEPVELWVNLNPRIAGGVYGTRLIADSSARSDRLALLHIIRDATGWHIEEVK